MKCAEHYATASFFKLCGPAVISPVFSLCLPPLQIEEENAALLAALTDSLDGMVDAEVGGLSVFPALGEEPDQEEEEETNLPLSAEDFSQPLGAETEDPSLVRTPFMPPVVFLSLCISFSFAAGRC